MIDAESRPYLPAFGRDFLLPLYDPFTRVLGVPKIRAALVAGADLEPGQRVLDVGCGTGSLLIACKARHPDVEAVGLDPDPKALARARRKAARAGVAVEFERGFADELPFDDASFDRVFSSLMLHHLDPGDKPTMLAEVRRVLAPGGRLELVDFARTHDDHSGVLHRWLHRNPQLVDSVTDHVVALMSETGLSDARVVARSRLIIASVAFYRAHRDA